MTTTAAGLAPPPAPTQAPPPGQGLQEGPACTLGSDATSLLPGSSKIRIRDGRAKPIDLLAKYISAEDDDLAVEMHEPYTFLNGLTVADMEDLLEDIQVYMELEQGKNADFWRDMTTVTEDEIAKLRKLEASGKGPGERREGVNASVSSDVQSVFKGKTYGQLRVIFQGIEGKIRAGGPNLDMGYWESLLQQLRAHMARARLRERHQDVLRQKLYKLKQEQGVESEPLFPILKQEPPSPGHRYAASCPHAPPQPRTSSGPRAAWSPTGCRPAQPRPLPSAAWSPRTQRPPRPGPHQRAAPGILRPKGRRRRRARQMGRRCSWRRT